MNMMQPSRDEDLLKRIELLENQVVELASKVVNLSEIVRDNNKIMEKIKNSIINLLKKSSFTYFVARKLRIWLLRREK